MADDNKDWREGCHTISDQEGHLLETGARSDCAFRVVGEQEEMATLAKKLKKSDWRSLPIAEQMQHLLKTGYLADCSFLVGEDDEQTQRIAAHKVTLCRGSEVFAMMFAGAMQEKGEVRVKDISPRDFKAMLLYVYTEKLDMSDLDMSLQVMMAANKYLIVPLVNKCVEFATEHMQAGDLCRVLHVASLLENKQLEHSAIKKLQEKTEEVLNASSWVDTPSSFVLTVVQQDCLNVSSELSLLTACQLWSRHNVSADQTARDVLAQFLPYLRLRTLTAEQFTKFTVTENCVVTLEECMRILQWIVIPGLKMSGVCVLTVPRIAPQVSGKEKDLLTAVVKSVEQQEMCKLELQPRVPRLKLAPLILLISDYHVLLYGVQYCPISTADVDILDKLVIENNQYYVSFTVELFDRSTKACVTALKYEGTVSYGSGAKDLFFPQPYLLKKHVKLDVKVTYHTQVKGVHQQFNMSNLEKNGIFYYFGDYLEVGLTGISQILYKIVK